MRAALDTFDRHFEWRHLPIWVSFAFLSGWLGIVTIWVWSDMGVTGQQAQDTAELFALLPWLFMAVPFFSAGIGIVVEAAIGRRAA